MTDVLTRPGRATLETTGAPRIALAVADHPLARLLRGAARRHFPSSDGTIEVVPAVTGPSDAAVAFTGYSMIAADVSEAWVREQFPSRWDEERRHHGAVSPHFVAALADRLGVSAPGVNVLLAAQKPPRIEPRTALRHSDRVRADWAAYRSDVVCYANTDGSGVINLGRGPAGRLDLWIDFEGAERPWLQASAFVRGRELLEAARAVAPDDLFASVPAYDAWALRTYLSGGFRVIGAEALFLTRPAR